MVDVTSHAFAIPLITAGLILVWLICRTRSIEPTMSQKVEAKEAAIPIAIQLAAAISLWIIYSFRINPFTTFPRPVETFMVVVSTLSLLVPTVCVVVLSRDSFRSVRLTFAHAKLSAVLGIIVSIILLVPTAIFSPLFVLALPKIDTIYLLSYVYVAFCEELLNRGLLQTRLEGFLGSRSGLVASAIMFNLSHAPAWILVSNMTQRAFIANVILSLPFAIVLGYIAQKSHNMVGSTIYHVAYALPLIVLN